MQSMKAIAMVFRVDKKDNKNHETRLPTYLWVYVVVRCLAGDAGSDYCSSDSFQLLGQIEAGYFIQKTGCLAGSR